MSTTRNNPHYQARERGQGKYGRPSYNQAAKITAKFGGAYNLASAVTFMRRLANPDAPGLAHVTVYRWGYSKPYGRDGLIPNQSIAEVERAARMEGIILTAADWAPERIKYPSPDDQGNIAPGEGQEETK